MSKELFKEKFEELKKIQEQKDFVQGRLGITKEMTKEQKIIVHVELDPELLEKIDQEAAKDLRTRKAQVLYILRERFEK